MTVLEAKNINVSCDNRQILSDVSFAVGDGETLILSGKNGSGKTTLARAIAGLETITDGELLLDNEDISRLSIDERARRGVFLCFQDPVAIPGLKIKELIRSELEGLGRKMRRIEFEKKLADLLDQLNLSPFFGERELDETLSGGERKKIEILQALFAEPKLLILDEFDAGLDAESLKNISALLLDYQQSHNAAFIVISHHAKTRELFMRAKYQTLEIKR